MKNFNESAFLRKFPIFECLTNEEFNLLNGMIRAVKVPKFGFIYNPNEPSQNVYFLYKGWVKAGAYSDNGKERIRSIKRPISMFGESALIENSVRNEFACAMNEEVRLIAIQATDLRLLTKRNHEFHLNLLEIIGNRLRQAEAEIESFLFDDARSRIVDFLKQNVEDYGTVNGNEAWFRHCLTQTDIANMTHLSRQMVTLVLNQLRQEHRLHFDRRRFLIRDFANLA